MFDKIDFKRSIAGKKIIWEDNGFSSKYFMLLMPAGWITIALIMIIKNGQLSTLWTLPKPFLISLPVASSIAFISFWHIQKNDRFEEININIPRGQFRKIIGPELIRLGWKVSRSNSEFMTITKRKWYTAGSRAAILFKDKSVFINVQNAIGNGAYFPFSFGRNKKLTDELIGLINSIHLINQI